jgi:D-alanyl-D-alanine carboxypeptidase
MMPVLRKCRMVRRIETALFCVALLLLAPPAVAYMGFGPTSPGISSIVIDAANGRVLSQYDADTPRYPASLTKLMTLDLAFQALQDGRLTLDTRISVSSHAASVAPIKLGLRPGDTITVRQAILAMTTMSANDAATALGEYLGGGSEFRCAQMMTLRAHALGMEQTEFENVSGLPNARQVTTARDMAILADNIIRNFPEYQKYFDVREFNFEGRTIYNIDDMLRLYPGATGMKTGFTDLAMFNVVTTAVRNGHDLIGVVLHAPSWNTGYQQMADLLDNGFDEMRREGHVIYTDQHVPAVREPIHPALANGAPSISALQMANRPTEAFPRVWTAQLNIFAHVINARRAARAAARISGIGIPRVALIRRSGNEFWNAQLAGLTLPAAYETCKGLAAQDNSCHVIASAGSQPVAYHLAMEEEEASVFHRGHG